MFLYSFLQCVYCFESAYLLPSFFLPLPPAPSFSFLSLLSSQAVDWTSHAETQDGQHGHFRCIGVFGAVTCCAGFPKASGLRTSRGLTGLSHRLAVNCSHKKQCNSKQYPGQADCDRGRGPTPNELQENSAIQGPATFEIWGHFLPTRTDFSSPNLPPAEA